ncbi:hemerythrin domain-containing protein [Alteromonas lipolytica]|uniref:Hemerythrin n=1 Tax=Alteromonas lipolytica TaxID=1856405 RepID=A0A1E8FH28_9ALTE|nr:hemerythrin domain-containing protein [Alteromonas lipolytica]OFI35046.1 hemerythrin [Alteromonas lipolytica]GGF56177.1 hemerythrin [Alteromonas lipolytica]
MTIFEALRQDHEKQRLLLKILVQTHGDTAARRDYFEELKDELSRHATAEERHFYSPLMEYDGAVELSRHGIAEHHEIDELLEKLDDTDCSSPAWLRYLKQLKEQVEHHLDDEEQEFFQIGGRLLKEQQKNALGAAYQEEMAELA